MTGPPAICRIRFSIFAILLGFCTAANIASAEKAEAWTALHTGRHAALMCHTDAPGGRRRPCRPSASHSRELSIMAVKQCNRLFGCRQVADISVHLHIAADEVIE